MLRLQSDERLVALIRRGNDAAFEILVSRYHSRLLAFCRHMLGSREDAEDILQDVMAAAYNAILADDRAINVRPWLYRIARNRSLNHLRRAQPVGMDSMDIHLHAHGMTTADKVHDREDFRLLVVDIQRLPESQRTALVLREMDALSYDQIAEAMETTIPSVKSLLVRARIGLAEASEARRLSCDEVRIELGEVAEGIQRKPSPLVRRHMKTCTRCATFQVHLKETSKSLAVLLPVGPLMLLRKLALAHLGHSAGSGAGAAAGSSAASGAVAGSGAGAAAAGAGAAAGAAGSAGSLVSAGVGALAAKAAASLAAAALVTAGAVEVDHAVQHQPAATPPAPAVAVTGGATGGAAVSAPHRLATVAKVSSAKASTKTTSATATTATTVTTATATTAADTTTTGTPTTSTTTTTSVTTVLPPSGSSPGDSSDPSTSTSGGTGTTTTSGGTSPSPTTTPTTTTTTTTPTSTTPNPGPTQGGGSAGGQ